MSFEQVVPLAHDTVNWTNFVGAALAMQDDPAIIAAASTSDLLSMFELLPKEED